MKTVQLGSPSYLVRNPHSYCFRMVVPRDLQTCIARKELRYSLRTGYIGVAKQKAGYLASQVQMLFKCIRECKAVMKELSTETIQDLVAQYIRDSIDAWDKPFYSDEEERPYYDTESLQSYINELSSIREDLIANINLGDHSMLTDAVDALLKANGLEIDKTSIGYKKLNAEIHKAEIKLIPLQQQHMNCNFSYQDDLPNLFPTVFIQNRQNAQPKLPDTQTSELLINVINEYLKEKGRVSSLRTNPERKRSVEHFLTFLDNPDIQIHEIDGKVMRDYKAFLRDEEIKPGVRRKASTINDKYLTFVKGIFTFAKRNGYIQEHPAPDLRVEDKNKIPDHEKQQEFTTSELKSIFCESPEYRDDRMPRADYFWIPLIALFTGARREEICQLYVSDLKQVDGIWCLDIQEEEDKPDKSVKTGERRLVPLHPFIAKELNFVGYVSKIKDRNGRIFYKLKRTKSGEKYGGAFGQWFSRFRKRCLPEVKKGKKTFHSFRHTLKTHLAEVEVSDVQSDYLTGHSVSAVSARYKKPKVKILYKNAVMRINYDLDLSHLKNSKWVVKK